MIASYLGALVTVLGLAVGTIALLRLAKGRGLLVPGSHAIRIVDNRALGTTANLVLVEIDGARLLVGTSRNGVQLIDRLAPDAKAASAPHTAEIVPFDTSFSAILRRAS